MIKEDKQKGKVKKADAKDRDPLPRQSPLWQQLAQIPRSFQQEQLGWTVGQMSG